MPINTEVFHFTIRQMSVVIFGKANWISSTGFTSMAGTIDYIFLNYCTVTKHFISYQCVSAIICVYLNDEINVVRISCYKLLYKILYVYCTSFFLGIFTRYDILNDTIWLF